VHLIQILIPQQIVTTFTGQNPWKGHTAQKDKLRSLIDSFRPWRRRSGPMYPSSSQHIVFAGTRDGGHLAQEALKHWPARGTYRTQLHVFASDATGELGYESIQSIEDRFKDDEEDVHIYDSSGNVAGHEKSEDDDTVDEHLKQQQQQQDVEKKEQLHDSLPDLKKIVFDTD
jgi:hypothetical protein